ncbi:MAG: SpoIIE family protein phosphatase [Prevotella sp.]|nr:SpoIIE family protein phosphatase [Prevotella sp.]
MRKSKLSRRITWRVILILVVCNVFIIGAVFLSDLAISSIESELRAQHIMEGINGKLTTMLSGVEITATNNVAEFEENLDTPEKVYEAMVHELRFNNRYVGCGIGFEPDFFPGQGRWFEPYVKFVDSTHVERKQIGSAQHDYHSQEWYLKGLSLERGEGYLTDPYYDDAGGKCIMSTYVTPVFDRQGRRVGVYGIDLNLSWLEQAIVGEEEKVKQLELVQNNPDDPDDENAFFIQLLDSKGKKIAGSETFDDETTKTILSKDSIGFEGVKVGGITYYISSKRLPRTGWTIVVAQHRDFVLLYGYFLGILLLIFMTIGSIVIFFFMSRSIRRAVKPLRFLSDSAQEVAHGNFDAPLPTFKHQDEIAQLRDSFGTMQQSLKQYVEELKESTAAKASIESELNVAHSIQMSMLPKTFPPFPERNDIELYGILKPAKAVGGDLYDFFIRDEKLFFCIGDVSGKGVPASLVMAVSRTLFRNISAHAAEPSHIVETMNEAISDSNDSNMFVTLFVGVLDLQTGHLRYCNAAHNAPYRISEKWRAESGEFATAIPVNPNLPVGAMPDWNYTEQETEMTTGSILFLYTDGLTEAENAQQELFGEQRVADVVTTFNGAPQELIETMTDAVHKFVGDTEQSDDLTMLAIKYTKVRSQKNS